MTVKDMLEVIGVIRDKESAQQKEKKDDPAELLLQHCSS